MKKEDTETLWIPSESLLVEDGVASIELPSIPYPVVLKIELPTKRVDGRKKLLTNPLECGTIRYDENW